MRHIIGDTKMKFIYFIKKSTFEEKPEILTSFEEKAKAFEWLKEKYEEFSEIEKYALFGEPENGVFVAVHKEFATATKYEINAVKIRL